METGVWLRLAEVIPPMRIDPESKIPLHSPRARWQQRDEPLTEYQKYQFPSVQALARTGLHWIGLETGTKLSC